MAAAQAAIGFNGLYRIVTENVQGPLPSKIIFNGVVYRPTREEDTPGYSDPDPYEIPDLPRNNAPRNNQTIVLNGKQW